MVVKKIENKTKKKQLFFYSLYHNVLCSVQKNGCIEVYVVKSENTTFLTIYFGQFYKSFP